jgi:hypothetical protein
MGSPHLAHSKRSANSCNYRCSSPTKWLHPYKPIVSWRYCKSKAINYHSLATQYSVEIQCFSLVILWLTGSCSSLQPILTWQIQSAYRQPRKKIKIQSIVSTECILFSQKNYKLNHWQELWFSRVEVVFKWKSTNTDWALLWGKDVW